MGFTKFCFEDGIENIDIGGPAMIRAAAKNHKDVLIVVLEYLKGGQNDQQFRSKLAWKAFQHVAAYDSAVSEWLWKQAEGRGGYGGFGSRKPLEVQARTGSTQSVSTSVLEKEHPNNKFVAVLNNQVGDVAGWRLLGTSGFHMLCV
ncbi:hypothetical protein DY000_02017898 [Brassica cretica]|uniref:Uncharacterized protein n=1 Tax=Brassica cretica TaxID=69181 RepID=A0ABQ7D005_BRACR|nr:hypothetical protein DY000_02017898 [Brassica cretica]